jgi:hypothetical protein
MAITNLTYRVTAQVNGEELTTLVTVSDHYAVTGMSEREAELLVDNTQEAYFDFYGDRTDDEAFTGAEWEDVVIELVDAS